MLAIANKYGEAAARTVAEFQMTGSGWVMSERLKKWLGVEASNIDNLIRVLEVHPAFQPMEYHHLAIKKTGAHTAELHIADCAALHESTVQNVGWCSLLPLAKTAGLGRHRERDRPTRHTHGRQLTPALDNHASGNRTHGS
jgi:hypothetical protein